MCVSLMRNKGLLNKSIRASCEIEKQSSDPRKNDKKVGNSGHGLSKQMPLIIMVSQCKKSIVFFHKQNGIKSKTRLT